MIWIKSTQSGIGESLGFIDPEIKFLFIYRPLKLEHKLSASKIQWWGRHGIDIPILKGKKGRDKGVTRPKQGQNPMGQIPFSSVAPDSTLRSHHSSVCPVPAAPALPLHPCYCCRVIFPFFLKGRTCLQVSSSISSFPKGRILKSNSSLSLCPLFIAVCPSWQCFCLYTVSKTL